MPTDSGSIKVVKKTLQKDIEIEQKETAVFQEALVRFAKSFPEMTAKIIIQWLLKDKKDEPVTNPFKDVSDDNNDNT